LSSLLLGVDFERQGKAIPRRFHPPMKLVLRLEKTFQDNKAKHKIFPANIAGLNQQNAALDSGKVIIMRGSYGGYMTWAIAYEI
jgi:hypothetical protein